MKKILFVFLFIFSINLFAEDNIKPQEGAFTSLYVSATDVDKYVSFLKGNSDAFKAIGSSDAGVCITRSGNQYPGQMMIWNAFPSVEAAMIGSLKYDPYKAKGPISKLRKVKHSTIWKSLKSFRLDPGHEVVGRFKVKQENIPAFVQAIENRQAELEGEYEEVQQKEQEIVQKLNEKYGPGQLDPQTGVFTPAPPQEEAAEDVEQS